MKSIGNLIQKMVFFTIRFAIFAIVFYAFFGNEETREQTFSTIEGIGTEVGKKAGKGKENAVASFKEWDIEKSIDDLKKRKADYEKRAKGRARKEKRQSKQRAE